MSLRCFLRGHDWMPVDDILADLIACGIVSDELTDWSGVISEAVGPAQFCIRCGLRQTVIHHGTEAPDA